MLSMTILATSMIVLGAVYYYKQFGENTAVKVLPVIFAPIFMFAYGAGTIWLLDLLSYESTTVWQVRAP